ncbi:hypothetical protein I9Y19_005275 [Citrobacter freundii]|uniref:Lar family restriction alleviation protein n=1 Tax=Citrobacter braakii TaxID=57706 RepID=UPI001DB055A9|nr:hypothetical protein [Citrobacter freundii]EKX9690821.1 hypothetical protein [Citrobacter freundii]HEB9648858.1 hypothetical protein [Citrobacter freundii]
MSVNAIDLKLAPCPFCGSEAFFDTVFFDIPAYSPSCTECSCELMDGPIKNAAGNGWYESKGAAANAWNKRAKEHSK